MKPFKNHTLKEYINVLSAKSPAPGGGSAAALSAAVGTALLGMSARYSQGKGRPKNIEKKIARVVKESGKLQARLLELVDLDAKAYLGVVKARQGTPAAKRAASARARAVPLEICRLCLKAVELTPDLVRYGNKHLMSDVEVAVELLVASYKSAMINVKINNPG